MKKLHELIKKRRKLFPWVIGGVSIFCMSTFLIILTPFFVDNAIFLLIGIIPLLIACIPFGVADALEYKIGRQIQVVFSERLKLCINDTNRFNSVYIHVKLSKSGKYYSLLISSNCIPLDNLSAMTNQIVLDMSKELPKKLIIQPVVFNNSFSDNDIFGPY